MPTYGIKLNDKPGIEVGLLRMRVLSQIVGRGYRVNMGKLLYDFQIVGPEIPEEKLQRIRNYQSVSSVVVIE